VRDITQKMLVLVYLCSISEMDKEDQMIDIYQKVIIWADVVIIATPIRWGNASSLYYQMVQRMNCVRNQSITHETYLIRDKAAAFIITGGQDNVQHVAGEFMTFWCVCFPTDDPRTKHIDLTGSNPIWWSLQHSAELLTNWFCFRQISICRLD
jgi:multimeric flavodoxin WrbA